MVSVIKSFLSNIQTSRFKDLAKLSVNKIVMGNEACDLDSAISCIAYAYFLYSLDKKMEFGVVYPILNIKRNDYPLRTEVNYWLNKFSISEDLLIFRDDVILHEITESGNLQLYIVDHNIMAADDAHLEPYVVSVIDHHQLERTDTPLFGMTVEPVGSCSTLVTYEIFSKNSEALDEDLAYLLYGTILVDTVNLSETANRTTEKDVEMIEFLEKFLNIGKGKRPVIFEELIVAKSDISQLSSEQIFRKDLKVLELNNICVAISSVPQLVKNYLQREDIDICLQNVGESFSYDIIVIMGIDVSGEVERDLAVVSRRKILREELSHYLKNGQDGLLELELVECQNKNINVFNQKNKSASRKIVLPLIKEWLQRK